MGDAEQPGTDAPDPPSEAGTGHQARPSRGRSVAALLCLVLAALLTTPAAVAFWGQRTLNDTARYVDTVRPLVESPEVQDVVVTKVTDAIEKQVDVEAILDNVLLRVAPEATRLQQLVGPLAAAVNSLIERQVREFTASEEFAALWGRVNTRAQQGLHRVLTGEGSGAASIQDGQVVLDVDEVIERVKERLAARGLIIVENVPVPETDRQLVLVDAPQVEQLRTIYAFGNPVARWLLPATLLLFIVAFVLARNRPRMTVAIGSVLVLNATLVALMLAISRQLFVNELSGTDFGPASGVFFDTLLVYLDRGEQVILRLGVILIVAGWFAGSSHYGTAVRRTVTGVLTGVGAQLADSQVARPGRWCASNEGWLRTAVIVLGGVVLLWGNDVSLERLWWSLALMIVLLAGLQALVGAGRVRQEVPSVGRSPVAGL